MRLLKRHIKPLAAIIWLALLAAGFAWGLARGLTVAEILGGVHDYVGNNAYAPVVFVILYGLRPLTFLPAMWLTIAAGSLFGFGLGVVCTIFGENLSAATAYAIARFFGRTPADDEAVTQLSAFRRMLQEQAFPTVMALRAAYLPFDPVNYGCGLLRVPWWPYFFGTFIGILPPMLTFVSFGASVEFATFIANLDEFDPSTLFDERQLTISLALLAASVIIAWFAHRQRRTA